MKLLSVNVIPAIRGYLCRKEFTFNRDAKARDESLKREEELRLENEKIIQEQNKKKQEEEQRKKDEEKRKRDEIAKQKSMEEDLKKQQEQEKAELLELSERIITEDNQTRDNKSKYQTLARPNDGSLLKLTLTAKTMDEGYSPQSSPRSSPTIERPTGRASSILANSPKKKYPTIKLKKLSYALDHTVSHPPLIESEQEANSFTLSDYASQHFQVQKVGTFRKKVVDASDLFSYSKVFILILI